MFCPSFKHENREGRKFCAECGAALNLACVGCGANNQPAERFCGECGKPLAAAPKEPTPRDPRVYTPKHLVEKILTSRSALEGERKQVTILFAYVRGSTELASELDPEEWHRIMDRFFQILAEGVHRFEGTVNEYRGDGIMALFGAPSRTKTTRSGLVTRHCTCTTRYAVTPTSCASGRGSTFLYGWASTQVRSWSARSARTCAWTTPRRGTRSVSRRGWRILPRRARRTSPKPRLRSAPVTSALEDLGRFTVKGVRVSARLRAPRSGGLCARPSNAPVPAASRARRPGGRDGGSRSGAGSSGGRQWSGRRSGRQFQLSS
jgi:class 3 adenylate cyclase